MKQWCGGVLRKQVCLSPHGSIPNTILSCRRAYCTFHKIPFLHLTALIGQFVSDVAWGELDVLLVDTPPGTSDEHLAVLENMKKRSRIDGAILVTTPQVITAVLDKINPCCPQ